MAEGMRMLNPPIPKDDLSLALSTRATDMEAGEEWCELADLQR